MLNEWTQENIQNHLIDEQVEESLGLDYKASAALSKESKKKQEITKDISAMANSNGGTIIYGITEWKDKSKKHLPEKIDPIDRTEFSKEWLEQVISNIQPRIEGLVIHPVKINESQNGVVYVVDIPKSTTAHQATDLRYYARYNFESVPIEDYRIREIMNRGIVPDIKVEFSYKRLHGTSTEHEYKLEANISNSSPLVINNFKLEIKFPDLNKVPILWKSVRNMAPNPETQRKLVEATMNVGGRGSIRAEAKYIMATWQSKSMLFPQDEVSSDECFDLIYRVNDDLYDDSESIPPLQWSLFADHMLPKKGEIPINDLWEF